MQLSVATMTDLDDRPMSRPRAVVLLSGGLDSATALAVALRDGFEACALTIAYGQRHAVEVDAARRVAASLGVARHLVLDVDLRPIGGSALTGSGPVPPAGTAAGIPPTYVPARNTIFLSLALGWAEVIGATAIFIGVNAVDFSGYPDCRPGFVRAFQELANVATKAAVEEGRAIAVAAPLIGLSKAQIIRIGAQLGVDYAQTRSCYDPTPDGLACGACDSCRLRRQGFDAAGVADPTAYARSAAS
jgi:7-cyano-7-deazaguanine synthase